jgi:polar amino acid transport system substrate-binding protein
MRPVARLLLVWLALFVCEGAVADDKPACDRALSLALHDHGLLFSNQSGEGIDKDVADELVRRSGCKFIVSVMPRARIWQLIEAGALDFSLSGITNETRDRFASFAWYFSNKYYLLVHKDAGVRGISDFENNPALKLGAIRGFRYGPTANGFVDRLDAERRVSYSTGLDPLYMILLDHRIQAMIIEPFDYPALDNARLREQTTILEFDDPSVPHGLIMSRKSLSPQQQQAWRALIEGMRADGTVRRIFEKYFPPELARDLTRF